MEVFSMKIQSPEMQSQVSSQGTSRVNVLSITIGPVVNGLDYPSLLHEQLAIEVEATVKGKEKQYAWIAKFHRVEDAPAEFARFQVGPNH